MISIEQSGISPRISFRNERVSVLCLCFVFTRKKSSWSLGDHPQWNPPILAILFSMFSISSFISIIFWDIWSEEGAVGGKGIPGLLEIFENCELVVFFWLETTEAGLLRLPPVIEVILLETESLS